MKVSNEIKLISICFLICTLSFSQQETLSDNEITVENFKEINSKFSEAFLTFDTEKQLIFGSLKGRNKIFGVLYNNGLELGIGYSLFSVNEEKPDDIKPFFILDDKSRRKDKFVGGIYTPYFNADHTVMYYSKNICKKDLREHIIECYLKLYKVRTNVGDSKYGLLEQELSVNVEGKNVAYPAIDEKSNYLYFISDGYNKPGSMEIMATKIHDNGDLGIVEKVKGFEKMGNKFSSLFIRDGVMYFSANKEGDLDIYKAPILEYNKIGESERLPSPINEFRADDFSFVFRDNEYEGYFCSNRDNPRDSDIYKFKRYSLINVEGSIYDAETKGLIKDIDIIIVDEDDNLIEQFISEDGTYSVNLPSKKNYKMILNKKGYTKLSGKILTKYITDSGLPYKLNFFLKDEARIIDGFIRDAQGNTIDNVSVIIYGNDENIISTTKTNSMGYYESILPKSDVYNIEISKLGFYGE